MDENNNFLIINQYSKKEFFSKVKEYLPDTVEQAKNDIHRSEVTIDTDKYDDLDKFTEDFLLFFDESQYDIALISITQATIGEALVRTFPFLEKSGAKFSITSGNTSLYCAFDVLNDTCIISKKMKFFKLSNPYKKKIPFEIQIITDLKKDIVTLTIDI